MEQISRIGVDLAKRVFQVHGVDGAGGVVLRRQLRRGEVLKFFRRLPPCLVGMEACATSHYWGREIAALGHEVRLMPPARVKPYVKWGCKNDSADAEACCEAVARPRMTFVPIKSVEAQVVSTLHRTRRLLVGQRTQLANALRGHMAEYGLAAAKGEGGLAALLALIEKADHDRLPAALRPILQALATQWQDTDRRIADCDRQIAAWHANNADSRRLATIPRIGPVTASALVAAAGDATRFRNGRQFAAWLGLVPRQNSSGGKARLGAITRAGDRYVRQLLVVCATGMLAQAKRNPAAVSPWFAALLARKSPRLATVALANKLARIAWTLLAKGGTYRAPQAAA